MAIKTLQVTSHQAAIDLFLRSQDKEIAIVPNSHWADEISRRIASKSTSGVLLGKKVFTVRDYLKEVAPQKAPIISRQLQRHILRQALISAGTKYFKTISFGVANTCYNAISKLKMNGITPDELDHILSTRGGAKEGDLLKGYRAYEARLKELGWHDEEEAFLGSYVPMFLGKKFLIGFQSIEPYMEQIFADATFFTVEPELKIEPQIFALGSPARETNYIADKISRILKEGVSPEHIAVYLKGTSGAAWDIAGHFSESVPFETLSSQILLKIVASSKLPTKVGIGKFITFANDAIATQMKDTRVEKYPYNVARTLAYADICHQKLAEIKFEFDALDHKAELTREEFADIVREYLKTPPALPNDVPFKFISFDDAGLYDTTHSFIPFMNDGYLPSPPASLRFFTEPDTLSQKADERINAIFPAADAVIKDDLKQFKLAHSNDTTITIHLYNTSGKESVESPFILKYPQQKIPTEAQPISIAKQACGTNLTSSKALSLLQNHFAKQSFSATKLEDFGNCPFVYFCRYLLGIEPPEDITPEVQPHDRGTLIHEILETFFKEHGALFISAFGDAAKLSEVEAALKNVVDAVFEKCAQNICSKYNEDMVAHFKKRATGLTLAVVTTEIEFLRKATQVPIECEYAFDEDLFPGIRMKGKIDRIDADDETFTVIDYKTGAIESVKSGIRNGTELQIPIYSEMARRHTNKEPAAAFLYSIKERKRKSGVVRKDLKAHSIGEKTVSRLTVTKEEWDELISIGLATAKAYVEQIRSGSFERSPHKCESYCDWKDVCRLS